MKNSLLTILVIILCQSAFSQGFRVSGLVRDSTENSTLIGVNLILRSVRDTTRWQGTVTDVDGKFQFNNIRPGAYLLKSTYIGYTNYQKRIFIRSGDIDLGTIKMNQSLTTLKGVEINATQIGVQQKGDTIQFNANAYKTNRDATAEDLITKMPGITSDATGVKAQGENVQQILVDGKVFFGDDANIALKNLPAEVIDKIEVFDRLSEQAQFTGFDDGQTRKTINIVTKKGISNGKFGKVYAGVGENGRYAGGGNVNAFKGQRKLSVIGLTNNINQQNFSNEDLLGIAESNNAQGNNGGGGGRGGRGGGGGGGAGRSSQGGSQNNFMVGQQSGISTTHAMGINYSNEWDKIELTGSYFLNNADNIRRTNLERIFITGDSGLFYNERNNATSKNFNQRLNFRLELDLDSANSIVISPSVSQQINKSNSALEGGYSTLSFLEQQILNGNYSYNAGYNFSNNILLRHRFHKRGRSISWNLTTNLSDRDANSDLHSLNDDIVGDTTIHTDQESKQFTKSNTYSSNIAFTEPIAKTGQLQINYTISLTNSDTDKKTFNLNNETGEYTDLNAFLSNVFKNTYLSNRGGISYRFNNRKINFTSGLNYQQADLVNNQEFPTAPELKRSFQNLLPQLTFNYRIARANNLRVIYRTATNAPSISQLQNVVNNRNPLFLKTGNPNLKQDYQQQLTLRYGKTNLDKGSSFLIFLYGNYVKDYIGNTTFIAQRDTVVNGVPLSRSTQLTYPVNVPENWNARTFVTLGLPLGFMKSNVNMNTGFNYNRTPAFINGNRNLAHNYSFSEGIVIGSNHEKIDFTISYTASYVIVKNTINTKSDNNYFNHVSSVRLTWQPWKGMVCSSNLLNTMYSGLGSGFNQSIWFWNASLGYKFLKDQALEVKINAFDILSQNKSINREVTETYIEDSRTNALTQYFMLMATYTLRNFK